MLAALGVLSLAACQLIVGVKDDDGSPPPADASGSDASDGDAGDAGTQCPKRRPPDPPTSPGGGEGAPVKVFAFRTIVIAPTPPDGGERPVIGYDLDNRCTGMGSLMNGAPCGLPEGGTAPQFDQGDGVDNAFESAFGAFSLVDQGSADPAAASFNKAISAGRQTLLLALGGYNGGPDDNVVNIGLVSSVGLEVDGGTPNWDGQDRWTSFGTAIVGGAPPLPARGYVANSTLVVHFDILQITFGAFELPLHEAVLTATIKAGSLVDGTIAGRALADDLIHGTDFVQVGDGGREACMQPGLRTAIRDTICPSRDIPVSSKSDGTLASCDGISVGIGFEAEAALLSDVQLVPASSPCADSGASLRCNP